MSFTFTTIVKNKEFEDPLNDIDPIMEQAFSGKESKVAEMQAEPEEEAHQVASVEFPDLREPRESTEALNQRVFKNIPETVSVE
jgi:hypothetical protein